MKVECVQELLMMWSLCGVGGVGDRSAGYFRTFDDPSGEGL